MRWLVSQGHTCRVVARLTGYAEAWVRTIVHRYTDQGPAGIVDRRHTNPGQPPVVPAAVREELRMRLADPPPDGGLWTGPKVATWPSARLERDISSQRAWEVLRSLGFTPERPRAQAADPAAQDAYKQGAA